MQRTIDTIIKKTIGSFALMYNALHRTDGARIDKLVDTYLDIVGKTFPAKCPLMRHLYRRMYDDLTTVEVVAYR